jgi:SAM-dependent methyltransferase
MNEDKLPKVTSFAYGQEYQEEQVSKHRQRHKNHWQARIQLAHEMIEKWAIPRFKGRAFYDVKVLDVGCSIGTMAIEMASRGFKTYGVDFDASAIAIAKNLCDEEGVTVEFHQGDVAEWGDKLGLKVDLALCFDIFEHLHDDELGAMLQSIRRLLVADGVLVFHTFPLQYDYLFFSRKILTLPLDPFRWLSPKCFERIVRVYALLIDIALLIGTGKIYKERIERLSHCNPTTKDRLKAILQRAGYEVVFIETDNIYPFHWKSMKRFLGHSSAHRNMYGVAYPIR